MLSCLAIAQASQDKKANKLVEKADESIKGRDFETAKDLLQEAIRRDSTFITPYLKLISLHTILRQSNDAHDLRVKFVNNVSEKAITPQVWHSLAQFEFDGGNYSKAKDYLIRIAKPDSLLSNSIEFSLREMESKKELHIQEMPSTVNRYAHQYLPTITIDNSTLIYTARATDASDEQIVVSEFDGTNWSEAKSLADNINTRYNEGACTVSADGRTLVFTSCEERQSFGNCDLYVTYKTGDIWSKPENLGKKINSSSWDSQPTLSADGTVLYFSSNRPGGCGGRDIWYAVLTPQGWSSPKNVGPLINTPREETTPFIYPDNSTLIFSSNGHVGLGGYDLYKVELKDSLWSNVKNLGSPINSYRDEVSLIISPDGQKAYFTIEERNGTVVSTSKLVTYAIDQSNRLVTGVTYITGTVKDAITDRPLGARMEIVNLSNREVLYQTASDSVNGRYFMVLPSGGAYGVFLERKNYLFEDYSFRTKSNTTDTIDFEMTPISKGAMAILNNVYFDFDSDKLNESSFEELDRVVKFLKENTEIKVEISGHTDNTGFKTYNLNLSERRAQSIKDYLTQKGIHVSRIRALGMGDTKPLTMNRTEEERAKNRRIEFRIQ
jgi:outer membrane protein OmpA-like peptidoglycan-associated protein/Tol biopolymer transport system component